MAEFNRPSLSHDLLRLAAPLTALMASSLPAGYWCYQQWTMGLYGGTGAAVLTPAFASGLFFLAHGRTKDKRIVQSENDSLWYQQVLFCAVTLLAIVCLDANTILFGIIALIYPLWMYRSLHLLGGAGWASDFKFPVFFLYFALPVEPYIYESVDTFLQEITADVAYVVLSITGYGVKYWNAHTLHSSKFYVIVDETCAGMNMIVSLAMYALVFAWLYRLSSRGYILVAMSIFPLAIASNGVRVAFIYILGFEGGTELAMGPLHDLSGFVAFLPTLVGVYLVARCLFKRGYKKNLKTISPM